MGRKRNKKTTTKRMRKDGEEEKSGGCKENQVTSSLPDDIILYIFTKIPADLLWANFMCLSKQWSSLISSPHFIYQNLRQSTQGIIFKEMVRVMDKPATYFMKFKFMVFKGTEVIQVHELHKSQTQFSILSSTNGLLLLYGAHNSNHWCHVHNPITKKTFSLKLIGPSVYTSSSSIYTSSSYALVFVPSTLNYSLVELILRKTPQKTSLLLHVHDLHGYMKQIEVPPPYNLKRDNCRRAAVAVDGVVYWELVGKGIACFDVSTEAFRLLPYPIWYKYHFRLWSMGGFLSSVEHTCYKINIWIFKDENWMIFSSAEINRPLFNKEVCYPNELLGNLNNGELIVFRDYGGLIVYDTKSKQWAITGDKSVPFSHHIHVNSLLDF